MTGDRTDQSSDVWKAREKVYAMARGLSGPVLPSELSLALDRLVEAARIEGGQEIQRIAANTVQARHGWQSAKDVEDIDVVRAVGHK